MNEYLKVMPLWVVILLWIESKKKSTHLTIKDEIEFFKKLCEFTQFNLVKVYCVMRLRGLLDLKRIGVVSYGVISFQKKPVQLTLFNVDEYAKTNFKN